MRQQLTPFYGIDLMLQKMWSPHVECKLSCRQLAEGSSDQAVLLAIGNSFFQVHSLRATDLVVCSEFQLHLLDSLTACTKLNCTFLNVWRVISNNAHPKEIKPLGESDASKIFNKSFIEFRTLLAPKTYRNGPSNEDRENTSTANANTIQHAGSIGFA